MEAIQLDLTAYDVVETSVDESKEIEGGLFLNPYLTIGAVAAATVAIYEAGKATGEFIYHVTH